MSQRKYRRLLNGLGQHGVLIRWTVSMWTGTRIWVQDETGYPVCMSVGTARAHLRRLESMEWGWQV